MSNANTTPAPVFGETNTVYVAVEISCKSWVVGIKNPARDRIGLHALPAADTDALKALIEEQQARAERVLGQQVRVLCCYEASITGLGLSSARHQPRCATGSRVWH